MSKITRKREEFSYLNDQMNKSSVIHTLDPLWKLILVVSYILIVISFHKYDFQRLFVMILFPVLGYQFAYLSIGNAIWKMRFILPVVCLIGITNPFFDQKIIGIIGNVKVTGGMVSMITLMMKGIFCILASYFLVSTTKIEEICEAFCRLHIPKVMVLLIMLTYRYLTIFMDEVETMTESYALRAPGQKGITFRAWGSFLGQLIIRSIDRAQAIYEAMQLRGFSGSFVFENKKYRRSAWIVVILIIGMICIRVG